MEHNKSGGNMNIHHQTDGDERSRFDLASWLRTWNHEELKGERKKKKKEKTGLFQINTTYSQNLFKCLQQDL